MIKENSNFIVWSHHYLKKKKFIGCRKRLFENNVTTIYQWNYRIFDERYYRLKKKKNGRWMIISRFFLNGKTIIFERWTVKFIVHRWCHRFPLERHSKYYMLFCPLGCTEKFYFLYKLGSIIVYLTSHHQKYWQFLTGNFQRWEIHYLISLIRV